MRTSIQKTIAIALTLCAVSASTLAPYAGNTALSPVPVVAEAAVTQGDFEFEKISVNCAAITKYKGSASSVTLPTQVTIEGSKIDVTEIGAGVFADNTNLRSITIPEGYTDIDKNAFYYCRNLSSVSLPSSIEEIGYKAFTGTGITSITIPRNVYEIDSYAFSNCTSLKNVYVNSSELEEFGEGAFAYCSSLKTISLSSGLKKISDSFANSCTSLTSISIPSTVTSIGEVAFGECTSLSSVNMPSSVTDIKFNAFENTPWIKSHAKTNGMVIINNNIVDTSSVSGAITIPYGVTVIPTSAFAYKNITKVSIPNSVTEIKDAAFTECSNLSEVTMPDSVRSIGSSAFCNCTSLKEIYLPASLETIKNCAFKGCSSLENVTGARHMNYDIDGFAFDECLNLKKINGYTVASINGGRVNLYPSEFIKKYFSKTDKIGFIQDYVDICCSYMVAYIKNFYPFFNEIQTAYALEMWIRNMCKGPREVWRAQYNNENYPEDIDRPEEYHRDSSVFLNGVAVCEGYSKAYYRALTKAGIKSEIAQADGHVWNMLCFNDTCGEEIWLNSDIYWNDLENSSAWSFCTDKELKYFEKQFKTKQAHEKIGTYVCKGIDYEMDDTQIRSCLYPLGDINHDKKVTEDDAELLRKCATENYRPAVFSRLCADMDYNQRYNSDDYNKIMNKAAIYKSTNQLTNY